MNKHISNQLKTLPLSPGVYFFKNKKGDILYIGKANKLRNRVRSYFTPLRQGFGRQAKSNDLSHSKQIMVTKITEIDTIVTSNESEALILESIHIKKHKPHFNVALKDDKSYNFVKVDYQYARPVVTTVRRPELDKGRALAKYFGPYTTGTNINETLRFLRRIFPYRKKSAEPTRFEDDLLKKRTLGTIPETDAEYGDMVKRLLRVLEGHSEEVIKNLKLRMNDLSRHKQYEKAGSVRDQIKMLQIMQSRQKIMSVKGESQDVISIFHKNDLAAVNVFVIRAGKLINKLNFLLQHTKDESMTTLLDAFLTQYYSEASSLPKELILPIRTSLPKKDFFVIARSASAGRATKQSYQPAQRDDRIAALRPAELDSARNDITITIPNHGKKRELIKLGEENAKEYLEQSKTSWEKSDQSDALKQLQKALKLKHQLKRIEGYDISNIQGQYSVGSMVVFTNGLPNKNEYRKFKIKTIKGANDVASLAEVLKRRFTKSENQKKRWPQPDIILLDGGKPQLSTVLNALKGNQLVRRSLGEGGFISLAKREEEVFQGRDLKQIKLDSRSDASRLLQRIRDEAHRFAQKYYHTRHARADTKSVLDGIPGIGPKTKKELIQRFGSVAGIKKAAKNDILQLLGKAKTEKLLENI
jgi:excinuclease ABC subunit C